MPSKREQMRARKRAQQQRTIIIAILIGVALVAAAGYVIWRGLGAGPNAAVGTQTDQSGLGQAIPPLADRSHVQDGTDPGPYNSDPSTSGRHYAEPARRVSTIPIHTRPIPRATWSTAWSMAM